MQQHPQVFLKALGALEVVTGHAAGGKGVGVGPVGGEDVQRVVPIGQVEHLVLQKMGYPRRGVDGLPLQLEAPVGPAVVDGKHRVAGGEPGLGHHVEPQPVFQHRAV